jgi:hypothetical protein
MMRRRNGLARAVNIFYSVSHPELGILLVGKEFRMGRRKGKGRRKVGRKKRRMRSKIRHRKG